MMTGIRKVFAGMLVCLAVWIFAGSAAADDIYVSDNFNRANSDTLGTMSDGVHSWHEKESFASSVSIVDNKLYVQWEGATNGAAVKNTNGTAFILGDDGVITATLVAQRNDSRWAGIQYRAQSLDSASSWNGVGYQLRIYADWSGDQDIYLTYYEDGNTQWLKKANIAGSYPTSPISVKVNVASNRHIITINGNEVIDYTETTSGRNTAGCVGLGGAGWHWEYWDDFTVTIPEPPSEILVEDFEDSNPNAGQPAGGSWIHAPFLNWKYFNLSTAFEAVTEHVTSGQYAAGFSFYYPRPEESSTPWPRACMVFPTAQDWSAYDCLLIDAYEDRGLHDSKSFSIELGQTDSYYVQQAVYLPNGIDTTAIVYFSDFNRPQGAIDLTDIKVFQIYQSWLTDDGTVYLDNIRLAKLPEITPEEVVDGLSLAIQFGTADTPQKPGFYVSYDPPPTPPWNWTAGAEQIQYVAYVSNQGVDPILQGYAYSTSPATIELQVPAGDYRLWLASVGKIVDFDVAINGIHAGSIATHRTRTGCIPIYDALAPTGTIEVTLEPRLAWALNAIVIYPANGTDIEFTTVHELNLDVMAGDRSRRKIAEWAGERTESLPDRTSLEELHKFVLYHGNPLIGYGFGSSPPLSQRTARYTNHWASAVEVSGVSGQRIPAVVHVQPIQNVRAFTASISPLSGGGYSPAPQDWLEVRAAHPYYLSTGATITPIPRILKAQYPISMREREIWTICAFVTLPKNCQAGDYRAVVTLQADDGYYVNIPIVVSVPNVSLGSISTQNYGIYYYLNTPAIANQPSSWTPEEQYLADAGAVQMADMVKRGMNMIQISANNNVSATPGGYQIDNLGTLDRQVQWFLSHGITGPYVLFDFSIFSKLASAMGYTDPLLGPPPGQEAEFYSHVTDLTNQIKDYGLSHGWPEMLHYPLDESTNSDFVRDLYTAVKAAGVRTYCTSVGNYGVGDQADPADGIDVYCGAKSYLTEAQSDAIQSAGGEMWTYSPSYLSPKGLRTVSPAMLQHNYGLYAWKVNVQGIIPWHYLSPKHGASTSLDRSDWLYVYPGEQGCVPTMEWEMYHQAIVDRALLDRLEELIGQNPGGQTEQDAQAYLDSLRTSIPDASTATHEIIESWMTINYLTVRTTVISFLEALG